jgi:hypothetical protein
MVKVIDDRGIESLKIVEGEDRCIDPSDCAVAYAPTPLRMTNGEGDRRPGD